MPPDCSYPLRGGVPDSFPMTTFGVYPDPRLLLDMFNFPKLVENYRFFATYFGGLLFSALHIIPRLEQPKGSCCSYRATYSYFSCTPSGGGFLYNDLLVDALLQFAHMRDDSNESMTFAQRIEYSYGLLERFLIQ